MKLLKCPICKGELKITGRLDQVDLYVECKDCGFSNQAYKKSVEVIRKRKVEV